MENLYRVLLVEPPGEFIRLDRCMQSNGSWGGVYRFPLNLCRIAGHLISLGHEVRFVDLQADKDANLYRELQEFRPHVCILSCGYPSMRADANTARKIKEFSKYIHVSTFGVAPTALKQSFFNEFVWHFKMPFDSIVIGGEPALGYERLMNTHLSNEIDLVLHSRLEKQKAIQTYLGRKLFHSGLYRSPFSGRIQTYIEGSYGCPKTCNFCVVNQLYGKDFAVRTPEDVINEIIYAVDECGAQEFALWDEGTTFQNKQIKAICEGLIELKKSSNPKFRNLSWNTRSTTSAINEETAHLMKKSGLTGLTLGLESFDAEVLALTGKGTTVEDNFRAIQILKSAGIISIGHLILGAPFDTRESIAISIQGALDSGADVLQVYGCIPYPGTELHKLALDLDLIRITDLTKYELCNTVMDTATGISHLEIADNRRQVMYRFYSQRNNPKIKMLKTNVFREWSR